MSTEQTTLRQLAGAQAEREADGLRAERDRLHEALAELVDAGEPFIGEAFPVEQMNGHWLRVYNRWLAAMNDARATRQGATVSVSTHHYTPCPVTKGRWLYERWLALRDVSPDDLWDYLPDDERHAWERLAASVPLPLSESPRGDR